MLGRLPLSFALAVVTLCAAAACSSEADLDTLEGAGPRADTSGTTVPPGTATPNGEKIATATGLPCDVSAVLQNRCQTCHSSPPQYGASTALVTYDDLQKPGPGASSSKKVYELVRDRIHDDARPMPPSPQPRLDAKELATLDAWFEGGTRSSDATCTNDRPTDGVKPLSCKPDTTLVAKTPFTMQPNTPTDQYMCFGVDVTLPKKRHVVGLAPKVDNKQIVHHILLFQSDVPVSTTPFPCEAFGSAGWKLVAGWAPGGNNLELPPEAGFPENKGTTHWVLQVHYNNATAKTGTDNSGYELCTTEQLRANDAGVVAFGSLAFAIPPRATHTIKCDYVLGPQFQNVKLFNASPHMHTMGKSISTERIPLGNNVPEKIFEQKSFSFEAQANFPIKATLSTGDTMRTRCTWANTSDRIVGWGENTSDEMCFDFVGYYPKIPDVAIGFAPIFTWVSPSLNAVCTPE